MELITKDHRVINCKFIDFEHNNEAEEGKVEITMKNGEVEYEEITNIAYINR